MIVGFFTDRDCFTMVRPTEEERDLQNVQSIDDGQLRPEFVTQMKTLRGRIFKRVKPKSLNGTNITGDSLLSLAEAYVFSINNGSVPCIESAWTSVCKDECQKASTESITYLKRSLAELVKSDGSSALT